MQTVLTLQTVERTSHTRVQFCSVTPRPPDCRTSAPSAPSAPSASPPLTPSIQDSLVVSRLLGENVFGCTPFELEGRSVLEIMHPDDHEPFMQTARALVAMAAGTSLAVGVRLYSVHALHRVSHHREGKVFEVMVDSLITATRPNRRASPPRPSSCLAHVSQAACPVALHGFGHPEPAPSRDPSEASSLCCLPLTLQLVCVRQDGRRGWLDHVIAARLGAVPRGRRRQLSRVPHGVTHYSVPHASDTEAGRALSIPGNSDLVFRLHVSACPRAGTCQVPSGRTILHAGR